MSTLEKQANLPRLIILLTFLFICAQVTFLILAEFFAGLTDFTLLSFTSTLFFTYAPLVAFGQFLLAQFLIYSIYVFLVWYIVAAISEGFNLRAPAASGLCLFLFADSVVTLFAWNTLYVPHSIFTKLILHDLFKDTLSEWDLKLALYTSAGIGLFAISMTIVFVVSDFFRTQRFVRHAILLGLMLSMVLAGKYLADPQEYKPVSMATEEKPNIIIIGFDAVRPDFLGYFNEENGPTPNFDEFLQSAAVFTRAYTPVARTMPSWADILTAQYPTHNQVRENNTLLDLVKIKETLPRRMQEAGYTTLYATDDRRYNSIDQRFGFDRVIGPAGTIPDFLLGTLNDFPLSNMISPTRFGKMLFPYNYANHGADFIYNPNDFLSEINTALQKTPNKPLFLAVHVDLSGWPFYWFNDHLPYDADVLQRYKNAVAGDDRVLGNFLSILQNNQLLNHAIVFLISDHGITQELHGDRIVKESNYEGDPAQMKVMRYRYADAKKLKRPSDVVKKTETGVELNLNVDEASPFDPRNLGIDTSFGYGGDLLSLKQNISLFAVKGYGVNDIMPHPIGGRSVLLDIGPTILDLLELAPLQEADGISLKPYLLNPGLIIPDRPIYLESAYSITAMEQRDIIATKVLAESLKFFYINSHTGAVTIYPPLMKVLLGNKQRAILQGDWLLVYYPPSERFTFVRYKRDDPNATTINNIAIHSHNAQGEEVITGVKKHLFEPYFVLVNVKTGKWTTSEDTPLAKGSPLAELKQNLHEFYGNEMLAYGKLGLGAG